MFSWVIHLSSGDQVGPVSTSQPRSYHIYADVVKDGRKMLAIVARKNDAVAKLLKPHVGSLVTIYVPQFGIAWTSTLAERRRRGYLYVRIPAAIKKLFEPVWKTGSPIYIIISIPTISLPTQKRA